MIENLPPQQDPDATRSKTTGRIWSMATGMLAICIPLSPATHTGAILPLAVLAAAAIGTAAVWKSRGEVIHGSRVAAGEVASQRRLQELEERLASLEGITNFEHKLLEAKYPGAAPVVSAAPVSTPPPMAQSG